jgi:glycosyltransferase involved in cell wall biosynthesis
VQQLQVSITFRMVYLPMKLVYLADTQIPSRATNGTQIMRTCAAFASRGIHTTLVHPHRFGNAPEGFGGDLWSFYGVPDSFRIVTLPAPLTLRLSTHRRFSRAARGLPLWTFVLWSSRPGRHPFVFYCRSMLGAWLATQAKRFWRSRSSCCGVFLELHDVPSTEGAWNLLRSVDGVVTNTDALQEHLCKQVPGLASRIITARNGVDPSLFEVSASLRRMARTRLGIPPATTIVGYTGRVNIEKGVPTILKAAALLQDRPVRFLLVGKVYDDMDARAARLPAVTLVGFVPPSEVAGWIAAADVCVVPTSADIPYADFTCPLKLFEYMAAGRPVLCSDLPVMREVVTQEVNGLFFRADDAESLADGIERLRTNRSLADSLAKVARSDAAQYTWERRAELVAAFIEKRDVTSEEARST